MPARLTAREGELAGSVFELDRPTTTIGRSQDNDIVVGIEGVSRRHAEVRFIGLQYSLADVGSTNGTYLNGARLDQPQPLHPGDIVAIPGVTFVFDADLETAAWAMESAPLALPRAAESRRAPSELSVDLASAEVRVRGRLVNLTRKEYLALLLLHERADAIVTKEELAARVWPEYGGDVSDYNIHKVISRLRKELEDDPQHPRLLTTKPGFGYRLLRR